MTNHAASVKTEGEYDQTGEQEIRDKLADELKHFSELTGVEIAPEVVQDVFTEQGMLALVRAIVDALRRSGYDTLATEWPGANPTQ
jgi:hypothetical protein